MTSPSRYGREGDPRRQGMAFGGHERERLVVGVDDHDPGRQPDRRAGHRRDLEQARPRPARCRTGARRTAAPSARTSRTVPSTWRSTACGRHVGAVERGRVKVFCHSWPKPWSGPGDALAGDGVVLAPRRRRSRTGDRPASPNWPSSRLRPGRERRVRARSSARSSLMRRQTAAAATAAASSSWISIASSRRVSARIWR